MRVIEDLRVLNTQYLMLTREYANNHPVEAIWVLGIDDQRIERIAHLTIEEINELSKCGRALMAVQIPDKKESHIDLGVRSLLLAQDGHV